MAEILRYVNPASTAGGDGTTNGTTGANRAYASLSEWDAAEETDLVSDGNTHVVQCVAGTDSVATVDVDGWTTGASNDITIMAEAGSEHGGVPGAGYVIELSGTFGTVLLIDVNYVTVQDIEVIGRNSATTGYLGFNGNAGTGCTYQRMICESEATGTTDYCFLGNSVASINTIYAHDGGQNGVLAQNFNNMTLDNCTAVNCANAGFLRVGNSGGSPTANNCVAYNNGTDFGNSGSVAWTGDYCASSDSTEPGTNPITTDIVSGDFVDAAGGDFTAKSGGTLDGAGLAAHSPATDVAGNAFASPPSVGAYEVVGGAGVTIVPIAMHSYRQRRVNN